MNNILTDLLYITVYLKKKHTSIYNCTFFIRTKKCNYYYYRFVMNRIRIHVLPSSRNRVPQTSRPQEPQSCSFTLRPCSQPRLEGLDFCIKHILEDKSAPYKQCSYVSVKNGKRCPNAAPKAERKDG